MLSRQSEAVSGRGPILVHVLREGDEERRRVQLLQAVPADGVQRGEHDVLAGLWGAQEGNQ